MRTSDISLARSIRAGAFATVAALAALLTGAAAPAMAQATSDMEYQAAAIAKGQALVEKHCASCHAIGDDDASPHESAPPFREIVTRFPTEDLAEALAEGIVSGHPDMPVFVLQPDEIEAFLAYLDSLAPPD